LGSKHYFELSECQTFRGNHNESDTFDGVEMDFTDWVDAFFDCTLVKLYRACHESPSNRWKRFLRVSVLGFDIIAPRGEVRADNEQATRQP